MMPMYFATRYVVVSVASLLFAACTPEIIQPSGLTAEVEFRCLWWSTAQMENFDPNNPPPKATEVAIERWEYSDPVGVPHPDIVDVVVTLKSNGGGGKGAVSATLSGQWRVGPIKDASSADWTPLQALKSWESVAIGEASSGVLRLPIDVAGRISALEKTGAWPWAFRAVLTVAPERSNARLIRREVELPIVLGD
jgi:hypothetical protein